MTVAVALDVAGEVLAISAALAARSDRAYEAGMRRTVPSRLPAHAVRVPEIRRLAAAWSREHQPLAPADVVAVAEALWRTRWREECIVAMAIIARRKDAMAILSWELVDRWSTAIENWEHVDNLAAMVSGPLLVARPDLIAGVKRLARSGFSWQRRLAIVTLIEAARDDRVWLPSLEAMVEALKGDRGPTMRKAVAWAQKTVKKLEARGDR